MTEKLEPMVEKVALAIAREVEGESFDPFADPEAFEYAGKLARAAIEASSHGALEEALDAIMNAHASNVLFHNKALAERAWAALALSKGRSGV